MKLSEQPDKDLAGMSPEPRQYRYGISRELAVSLQENEFLLKLGGLGQDDQPWAHVMTRRVAQVLWFKLTTLLYPDKAAMVTSLATTAPLSALSLSPTLTTHIEVVPTEGGFTLVGRFQRSRWLAQVTEDDARQLWAILDQTLYPVGWEGRTNKGKKVN